MTAPYVQHLLVTPHTVHPFIHLHLNTTTTNSLAHSVSPSHRLTDICSVAQPSSPYHHTKSPRWLEPPLMPEACLKPSPAYLCLPPQSLPHPFAFVGGLRSESLQRLLVLPSLINLQSPVRNAREICQTHPQSPRYVPTRLAQTRARHGADIVEVSL